MTSPNSASVSRVREGDVLAGKYRVERVLGVGGMGVVVAAEHMQLRQRVAIKLLLPDADGGTETMARFAREAQAAARIHSEHVARVIDVAALEDGSPYIVMEFLGGQDLAQVLAERGPLPLEEAVGYLLQACEGVAEAHAAGIIHRDLKPSNLFVCQRGGGRTIVKVLDFGISRAQPLGPGADPGLTRTGNVMGSPLYMSPEQMSSAKHVDARTDVWSLGVTLFELISGRTPFSGESITELIVAVLQTDPISVLDLRPELPASFAPVMARALEKDRDRRYPNVAKLAGAIAPFGPRHAALSVERIEYALAVAPLPAGASIAIDETHQPRGLSAQPGFAHEVTAEAVSASPRPGGSTTTKAVLSDRPGATAHRSTVRRRAVLAAGVTVVVALGIAAAMKRTAGTVAATATATQTATATVTATPTATGSDSKGTASSAVQPLIEAPTTSAGPPSPPPSTVSATPNQRPAAAEPPHKPGPARAASPSRTAPTTLPAKGAASPSSPASPSTPAPAPSCRVVQYFDAEGEARFRRECP